MANMSYCRFENTLRDLQDCVGALQEALDEGMTLTEFKASLNEYERSALVRMLSTCEEFQEAFEELVTNEPVVDDMD